MAEPRLGGCEVSEVALVTVHSSSRRRGPRSHHVGALVALALAWGAPAALAAPSGRGLEGGVPTLAPLASPGGCSLRTLPEFVQQGARFQGNVADVVEVECAPADSGQQVSFEDNELKARCGGKLKWATPQLTSVAEGKISVPLDLDGKATVVLWAGPKCSTGSTQLTVEEEFSPFYTEVASFSVLAAGATAEGAAAEPAAQPEDASHGSVATVVEVEFPPTDAGQTVALGSDQLYTRCHKQLKWFGPGPALLSRGKEAKVELDGYGNASVVLVSAGPCAAGHTLIFASQEGGEYQTFSTGFTIEPPGARLGGGASA